MVQAGFFEGEENPYGLMEEEVLFRKVTLGDPIFLPYLMGERAPLWNDKAKGVLFGLSRHHKRHDMIRAVFESAAFSLKQLCDEVELVVDVKTISVSGGLARLNTINQMKADVLNKEIKVLAEFETTSIGAYIYLLRTSGRNITLDEINENTKVRQIIVPDSERHEMYSERFELFKSIYGSLADDFNRFFALEHNSKFSSKKLWRIFSVIFYTNKSLRRIPLLRFSKVRMSQSI